MNERRTPDHPPPPRGAGAGGGGRSASANVENARPVDRACSVGPKSRRARGWAPDPEAGTRQKDRTRTKLRAKRLRADMTPAEKEMWTLLRSIDGVHFRKQPAIDNRVYDFGCYGARVLIEVDGGVHDRPEVQADDKEKTLHAVRNGFRFLRFTNADVFDRPAWVLAEVRARIDAPHPLAPAPQGGGGEESSTK